MPYKFDNYVHFEHWESLKPEHTISDEDYEKLPLDSRSSWKNVVDKPTHTIVLKDEYYCIMQIGFDSTRQDDIKNWFSKKI